jgi:hypothetical protein
MKPDLAVTEPRFQVIGRRSIIIPDGWLTTKPVWEASERCSETISGTLPDGEKFTQEIKINYLKFDNGSRIMAFSSNPYAMAVFGGDVGLDEFAKHQNAEKLWETAQGRITWGYDIGIWSAHDGTDTLFYQFAQEARAGKGGWSYIYRLTTCLQAGEQRPPHTILAGQTPPCLPWSVSNKSNVNRIVPRFKDSTSTGRSDWCSRAGRDRPRSKPAARPSDWSA